MEIPILKNKQCSILYSEFSTGHIYNIDLTIYTKKENKIPFQVFDNQLYAEKQSTILPALLERYEMGETIKVAAGTFKIESQAIGFSSQLLGRELNLLKRLGGVKIHLYGRVGHWPLKKAIQDAQILPWLRHTIQILVVDNVMLGVLSPKGFWLAHSDYVEHGGWQPVLISDCGDFSQQSFSHDE